MTLPAIAQAANLAYVRASSQYQEQKDPARYHPLNLLDDDSDSHWCEGSDGLGEGESLRLFFKRPQKIDRIVAGASVITGRFVTEVTISDGTNVLRIPINHNYVEQTLSRPMRAKVYTITITEVGGPNPEGKVGKDVACLGDVMLYQKRRAFGGGLGKIDLGYVEHRDRILGAWAGGPMGAPEKSLTFAVDGSWAFEFTPLLDGKRRKLRGEYRFRGERLLMRVGGAGRWRDVGLKYRRVKVEDDNSIIRGDYDELVIAGAIDEVVQATYNNAQF